jgi:predicted peptidase
MSGSDASLLYNDQPTVPYRLYEVEIAHGMWTESEFGADEPFGAGWEGTFQMTDDHTAVATETEHGCVVTYDLKRTGDDLTINVDNDSCAAQDNDVEFQTAIYQSSPFHLVQAPDWKPADFSPGPQPSATPIVSTSGKRLVQHTVGTVPGANLGYLEYLPAAYASSGAKSPLLVFLHGSGESGKGDSLGLSALSGAGIPDMIANSQWPDDRPFVVLAPQHDAQQDPPYCFTPAEIDSFLKFALSKYNVDPTRVYLTGLSCGAIGLWSYLGEHTNEVVAAAVPIAGYGVGAFEKTGCAIGRVPIWAFHGALDSNVEVSGDVYPITKLNECTDPAPAEAKLTVFPLSDHDVWTRTYTGRDGYDIYGWLLSHTKSG